MSLSLLEKHGNLPNNIELARKCLGLIRDIAGRAEPSSDPQTIGWALQELSQVLLERVGIQERYFEPVEPDELRDLPKLLEELDFVDGFSREFAARVPSN
jgi:hypothetical protein